MLRVGVLGCGAIGAWHARIVNEHPGATLAAVCDLRQDLAEAAAYGAEVYRDPDRLFAEAGLDAVIIATPEGAHIDNAKAAAAAGCAMLVEKPVAIDPAGVDAIIDAAQAADVILMAGHVERFETGSAQLVDAVRQGVCGRLASLCARRQFAPGEAARFTGRSTTVRVLGVHDFDLVRWVHPAEVTSVYACGVEGSIFDQTGLHDHVFTTIRFADGVVASVESAWTLPPAYAAWSRPTGWSPAGNNRLDVFGADGFISNDMGLRTQQLVAFDTAEGFRAGGIRHQSIVHGRVTGALVAEVAHFLDCVREGTPPLVGGIDAKRAIALTDAAERSLKSGQPVSPVAV